MERMNMRSIPMVMLIAATLTAGPARAEYAKGQELMILTLRSALLAEQYCPYRMDEKRLQGFLSRKQLTRSDLTSGHYSTLLDEDLAADTQRYQADTTAACDQAWASFGPDSPLSDLLRKK